MEIITIHSRKGGVGKSSIALSAALQVSALGHKVALIELDSQGSGFNQYLRLANDWSNDETGLSVLADGYAKRPRVDKWLLDFDVTANIAKTLTSLLLLRCDDPEFANLKREVDNVRNNLCIGPLSCFPSDLNKLNTEFVMLPSGRRKLHGQLDRLIEQLYKEGYRYAFLDQTQGLSFTPGSTLSWALEQPFKRKSDSWFRFHVWFVSGPGWADTGLLLYEATIYTEFLRPVTPILIVNRNRADWIYGEYERGDTHVLGQKGESENVGLRLFSTPMWTHINIPMTDLYERFSTLCLKVALLGWDKTVEPSMIAPHPTGRTSKEQLQINFDTVEKEFILPALKAATRGRSRKSTSTENGQDRGFHDNVFSALVRDLLASKPKKVKTT
jgi:cellulose biosynthesis protein BcsQ